MILLVNLHCNAKLFAMLVLYSNILFCVVIEVHFDIKMNWSIFLENSRPICFRFVSQTSYSHTILLFTIYT